MKGPSEAYLNGAEVFTDLGVFESVLFKVIIVFSESTIFIILGHFPKIYSC